MLKIFKEEQPCLSRPLCRVLRFNPEQSVKEEPGGFMGTEGCDTVNNRVKEGGQRLR